MIQQTNLKWTLIAVIAGVAALLALPRLLPLPSAFEALSDISGSPLVGIIYLSPLAVLVSLVGLITVLVGAIRKHLLIVVIGFFIALVNIVYVLLNWLVWGFEYSSWDFFPLVGLFDYEFEDFDVFNWLAYFHYNFVVFLFAALGFLILRLWSERRIAVEIETVPSTGRSDEMSGQINFCPSCGEKTVPGGSFCPKCGAGLTAGASNARAKYNTLAIVAFVISWIVPIVGFFLAYAGRREIEASGGSQKGDGFVLGALILNWVWVGSLVLIFLLLAVAG